MSCLIVCWLDFRQNQLQLGIEDDEDLVQDNVHENEDAGNLQPATPNIDNHEFEQDENGYLVVPLLPTDVPKPYFSDLLNLVTPKENLAKKVG